MVISFSEVECRIHYFIASRHNCDILANTSRTQLGIACGCKDCSSLKIRKLVKGLSFLIRTGVDKRRKLLKRLYERMTLMSYVYIVYIHGANAVTAEVKQGPLKQTSISTSVTEVLLLMPCCEVALKTPPKMAWLDDGPPNTISQYSTKCGITEYYKPIQHKTLNHRMLQANTLQHKVCNRGFLHNLSHDNAVPCSKLSPICTGQTYIN